MRTIQLSNVRATLTSVTMCYFTIITDYAHAMKVNGPPTVADNELAGGQLYGTVQPYNAWCSAISRTHWPLSALNSTSLPGSPSHVTSRLQLSVNDRPRGLPGTDHLLTVVVVKRYLCIQLLSMYTAVIIVRHIKTFVPYTRRHCHWRNVALIQAAWDDAVVGSCWLSRRRLGSRVDYQTRTSSQRFEPPIQTVHRRLMSYRIHNYSHWSSVGRGQLNTH